MLVDDFYVLVVGAGARVLQGWCLSCTFMLWLGLRDFGYYTLVLVGLDSSCVVFY